MPGLAALGLVHRFSTWPGAVHRVVTGLVVMLWPWLTCWLPLGSSSFVVAMLA